MATFPEANPSPIYPLTVSTQQKTRIDHAVDGDGGAVEYRRKVWVFPKRNVRVGYHGLTADEVHVLSDFHEVHGGRFESFYIYDLTHLAGVEKSHTNIYVGRGDGVTTVFDLPGRNTSSQVAYVDQVVDGSAVILSGGGASGSDRIQYSFAPGLGSILTCDFTGPLRMHVRFKEDKFERVLYVRNRFQNKQFIDLVGAAPV